MNKLIIHESFKRISHAVFRKFQQNYLIQFGVKNEIKNFP
jgi:hypothetical protein